MSTKTKFGLTPIALAMAVSLPIAAPSLAQDSGSFTLEEIVVTARKVEESLQDVSLSISAFTAEDITKRSIEELEDVALYTPGLTFEDFSNGGFGTPTIRGASQISITQLEQNVSTFIDGVYIPRQYAVDIGTMNLERIEVVKGPQSALYGANSFQGAINYVSTKANLEELEIDVSGTLGDNSRKDFSASVSVPIVSDKLALRVAAGVSEYDGDYENDFPDTPNLSPGTNGKIGGWDNESYEVSLVAQPTEALSFELGYKRYDVSSETKAQTRLTTGAADTNCGGRLFGGFGPLTTFCGELPNTPVLPGTDTPTGFVIDPRSFGLESESEVLTAGLSYNINDNLTINYLYGDIQGEVFSTGSSDRDPLAGSVFFGNLVNLFTQRPVGDFDYTSHEFRLDYVSDSGFTGLLGAFFSEGEDFDGGSAVILPFGVPIEAITEVGAGAFASDAFTETEITAVFGRASIPLGTDDLVLAVEGRYTEERKDLTDSTVVGNIPQFRDAYATGRVSLDYTLAEDSLVYLSLATGVKAGGINSSALATVTPEERFYGRDENTTLELGSKNTFLDGRMQLNAAAYYIDWSDLQIQTLPSNAVSLLTTGILTNIGSAESKGIEFDLTYAVTEAVTVNASLALNDATYDDGTFSQRIVRIDLCGDGSCPEDGNLGGNSLPRSSDTQWNLGAMYEGNINQLDFFVRTDVAGQSEQFVSELNTAIIPSRTLVNFRAGVSDDNWSAELWVKNATDRQYVSNSFFIPLSFQTEYVPSFGNRRRAGVTLNYNF